MKIMTPAVKGQLTKAANLQRIVLAQGEITHEKARQELHTNVKNIFRRFLPREQAKHATRKYMGHVQLA
jgi:hypothetical protein